MCSLRCFCEIYFYRSAEVRSDSFFIRIPVVYYKNEWLNLTVWDFFPSSVRYGNTWKLWWSEVTTIHQLSKAPTRNVQRVSMTMLMIACVKRRIQKIPWDVIIYMTNSYTKIKLLMMIILNKRRSCVHHKGCIRYPRYLQSPAQVRRAGKYYSKLTYRYNSV